MKFELSLDLFNDAPIPTKFYHPMFNRSEVIMLTNKQTNKSTNKQTKPFCWKHPPRSAMLRRWKNDHNRTTVLETKWGHCEI